MSNGAPDSRPTPTNEQRAEGRARALNTWASVPLGFTLITLFLPAAKIYSGGWGEIPLFAVPLPWSLLWPAPTYLAAGVFAVVLAMARRRPPGDIAHYLLRSTLWIAILSGGVLGIGVAVTSLRGLIWAALALLAFPVASFASFIRAARHQGARALSFLLLSYSLTTAPLTLLLGVGIFADGGHMRYGGYITFVALILVFLISLLAVIPPGPPDDYKGQGATNTSYQ